MGHALFKRAHPIASKAAICRSACEPVQTLESRMLLTVATHLPIVPTFDATITKDPKAAQIEAAINAGIKLLEADFSTPITVKILFEEGQGLGSNLTNYDEVSYAAYRAALVKHATDANDAAALATLPTGSVAPVNDAAMIDLTTPNERALGFPSIGGFDSTITLQTNICNLTRTSVDPNKYDLESVALHEMDEVLGLGSELDNSTNGVPPSGVVEGQDLYRFARNGQRSYTTNAHATSYFSINGGKTDLAQFNQDSGGDYGDWYSVNGGQVPQVQDAFGTPGAITNPNVELTALDVLGYTPTFNLGTGIIKGTIFNDANGNGVRDSGEANLAGWTIQASQNGKVVTTALSDITGYELTGLPSGTYLITEVPMPGYRLSTPAASYTVTISGQQTLTVGAFGDTTRPLLGGLIFSDAKNTGKYVAGDPVLQGWVVDAIAAGRVVATAVSNASGVYSFTGLNAGTTYTITEVVKSGHHQTSPVGSYVVAPTVGQVSNQLNFGNH